MAKNKIRGIEKSIDNAMGVNQLFKSTTPKEVVDLNKAYKKSEYDESDHIKSFNLKLPKHMHVHVKKMAIDKEKSINELLIEAISHYYKI